MTAPLLALVVCVCGGLGASLRYVCDSLIKVRWSGTFPLSTFVINAVAGLAAGVTAALYAQGTLAGDWRALLATGLLGGFSTFSTAINEVVSLARGLKLAPATWYLASCICVPVAALAAGYAMASLI